MRYRLRRRAILMFRFDPCQLEYSLAVEIIILILDASVLTIAEDHKMVASFVLSILETGGALCLNFEALLLHHFEFGLIEAHDPT